MMQGPDGLIYTPMEGRPWGQLGWDVVSGTYLMWAGVLDDKDAERPSGDQLAGLTFDNGRALGAFTVYALKQPHGPWRGPEAARTWGCPG